MKKILILLSLVFTQFTTTNAQYKQDITIKLGGAWYINCQHLVRFGEQDVINISLGATGEILPAIDIFSESGIKTASVSNGKLNTGNKADYSITSSEKEFTLSEKATKRVICYVKKIQNKEKNREELHVWLDLYMPDGFYFQCTPDETNVPFLQGMKGATFKNNRTAVQLN